MTDPTTARVALPPLPDGATYDHTAMAVPRIVDALPLYLDLLGGSFVTGGDNQRVGYRGVQLAYPHGKLEILEPLPGSQFLDSFFAKHPSGGLHHVTFVVPSLRRAAEALTRQGFTLHGEHVDDAAWQEMFIHPRQASGLLLQLAQVGPGYGDGTWTLESVLTGSGNHGSGTRSPGA